MMQLVVVGARSVAFFSDTGESAYPGVDAVDVLSEVRDLVLSDARILVVGNGAVCDGKLSDVLGALVENAGDDE